MLLVVFLEIEDRLCILSHRCHPILLMNVVVAPRGVTTFTGLGFRESRLPTMLFDRGQDALKSCFSLDSGQIFKFGPTYSSFFSDRGQIVKFARHDFPHSSLFNHALTPIHLTLIHPLKGLLLCLKDSLSLPLLLHLTVVSREDALQKSKLLRRQGPTLELLDSFPHLVHLLVVGGVLCFDHGDAAHAFI